MKKLERIEDPNLRDVLVSFLEETEKIIGETVRRSEFLEFVKTTNENFNRVWNSIDRLTQKVEELAEAQKRTDERLNSLTKKVEELAEAQKKTDERLNSLTKKVEELAEAQKKTDERLNSLTQKVEELAEAQKKTEQKVEELAEAQKKTEQRLEKLIGEHQKTRQHLGGLSNAFGYVLEDRAIKGLPAILKERFNMEIVEPLRRDVLETPDGKEIELNIFGKAEVDGKRVTIIGECKSQMRKRDVDKFLNYVKMLDRYITGEKFLVLVAYQAPLKIRKYIKDKGIHLVFSYELPLA